MSLTNRYVSVAGDGDSSGDSEENAWTLEEAVAGYAAGQHIWIKAGTYTLNNAGTLDMDVDAGDATPVIWEGYTTTIGDGGRATFRGTNGTYAAWLTISGKYNYVSGIDIAKSNLNMVVTISGNGSMLLNSKVENTYSGSTHASYGVYCDATYASVVGCHVIRNNTSSTFVAGAAAIYCSKYTHVSGCLIESPTVGIGTAAGRCITIKGNLIIGPDSGTNAGIYTTPPYSNVGYPIIENNTIHGFSTGMALTGGDNTRSGFTPVINNIISTATTGIALDKPSTLVLGIMLKNNAFYDCTTETDVGNAIELDSISLTADPFEDESTGDYRINDTAGGGALCRNVGTGLFFGSDTYRPDLGALARVPASGGNVIVIEDN